MQKQFDSWMRFYGKVSSRYKLEKGDFLSEKYQDAITSATYDIIVRFTGFLQWPQIQGWP